MLKKHKNIPQSILDIVSTLVLQVSVILSHSYLIIIYMISSIINNNFKITKETIIIMVAGMIFGVIGGIIGVNKKQ